MPYRPPRDYHDDEADRPRRPRRRDEEEDDDRDDRPRRLPKRKARGNGPMMLLLFGGVSAFLLVACGLGAYFLDLLPGGHPGKRLAVTNEVVQKAKLGMTIQDIEQAVGAPGYVVPRAEWPLTTFTADARTGATQSLAARYSAATNWYQWGAGKKRLFVGTATDGQGREVAVMLNAEIRDGSSVGISSASMTPPR